MNPYEIGILLHYYTSPSAHPHEGAGTDLFNETISAFLSEKLLTPNPVSPPPDLAYPQSAYKMTHRGQFYCSEGLCKVPLPTQEWRFPV